VPFSYETPNIGAISIQNAHIANDLDSSEIAQL
jgi:hypothetical protein